MPLYPLARGVLFGLPPETAHHLALSALRLAAGTAAGRRALRAAYTPRRQDPIELFGLRFTNRVGLAAGYDKDGLGWRALACLGFGHIEIGTVTPRPQPGNPAPRIFRLPEHRALINRMGFPGEGAEVVAGRLRGPRPAGLVLGVNLGKNKDTPNEAAAGDYVRGVERFAPLADYLAINVSSPNTVGLRRLQARDALEALLREVMRARDAQVAALQRHLPLLVKLAPDLDDAELDDAVGALLDAKVDGVIATNTTLARPVEHPRAQEAGGLSGAPLRARATAVVRAIATRARGALPVIAVGGVMDRPSLLEKLEAGASLVQVYTGLVYAGPCLIRQLVDQTTAP